MGCNIEINCIQVGICWLNGYLCIKVRGMGDKMLISCMVWAGIFEFARSSYVKIGWFKKLFVIP